MINSTASDHTALTPDQEPPDRGAERSAQSHDSPGWVTRRFRANPMRTAWVVTVISFITCCALAIAAPLTARGFVLYATDTRPLELNVIDGAVLVTTARTRDTQAVVSRAPVSEDQRVATDEKSSAILTFYADEQAQESLATITLYNNASFLLTTARVPRFSYSGAADRLSLYLEHGRIRVSPSHRSARPLQVVVETPHGSAHLPDGSYSVEVRNEETQVTTRGGEATVIAGGQVVIVPAGITRDGRQAVFFSRRGQEGVHAETEIRQDLNVDVRDFDVLNITFYVQLVSQSLQGAGMQSSEFPLAAQISYTDIYGVERLWTSGFYYLDLDSSRPWPLRNVQKIPRGVWYAYESPDLIELLRETRPSHINWIRFYASGYNYESLISEAELLVR